MLTRPFPVYIPGRQSSLHSDADLMRSCGDTFPGDSTKLEVLQHQLRFTARFRLESHLKYDPGAGHTLGGQTCRTESPNFTVCVINAPTLKEGGSRPFSRNYPRSR